MSLECRPQMEIQKSGRGPRSGRAFGPEGTVGGSCLAFEDDHCARMRVTCMGWQEIKLAGRQGLDQRP